MRDASASREWICPFAVSIVCPDSGPRRGAASAAARRRRSRRTRRSTAPAVLRRHLSVHRLPRRHAREPHPPRAHGDAYRHRSQARRDPPLVPGLPRRRPTATSSTWPAASVSRSTNPTGCAASATAKSTATGGPASTAAAPATGTEPRATCYARTATTRTSRASKRWPPSPRRSAPNRSMK